MDKSSEEYRKNFEWADKMAKKIEQSTEYVSRNVETNNGDDDEEVIIFSHVYHARVVYCLLML